LYSNYIIFTVNSVLWLRARAKGYGGYYDVIRVPATWKNSLKNPFGGILLQDTFSTYLVKPRAFTY